MPITVLQPTDALSTSRAVINANFAFLAGLLGAVTASATLNFPSIPSGESRDLTATVTGATAGNPVFLGAPAALEAGLSAFAWVSSANTVTVRLTNLKADGTEVDPASATYKFVVF